MAATSILPPQQHKQPSRKGKKAWRKNVDVTEVQEGLDELREQEIKHGGLIEDLPSSALFVTDTTGSTDIQQDYARTHKTLKQDEILAQRSAVPALLSYKRSADHHVSGETDAKKRRKDYVPRREVERLRKIAYGGDSVQKDIVQEGGDAEYDPWADEAPVKEPTYSFLEEKKAKREPRTLKRAPISMAKSGREIPAVTRPDKGKSYNPVFEDWAALVDREGAKATALEMERLEEERKEAEKQAMIAKAQAEEDKDTWESEWESEWEGIMSEKEDNSDAAFLRKKRPERKTPAERNKVRRRKMEEGRKLHEQKMAVREQDLARVRALAKEADAKKRQKEMQVSAFPDSDDASSSASDDEDIQLRRKGLGRAALPDAPLEVVLADELEESLRRLKPEGNLLQDRYRSMILRGRIESRTKITQPKKPKREVKEKWGYKDWKLK